MWFSNSEKEVEVARKMEAFPVAASQRYPWDQWLNGEVWQLFEAEDFRAKPSTVIASGRAKARRMGGTLRTRILDDWSYLVSVDTTALDGDCRL